MGEKKIKKITFIINGLDIGGTEKQLLCLINLIKKKYKISIFAFSSGNLLSKFRGPGVKITYGNNKFFSVLKLAFFLFSNDTDIYHFFLPKAYLIGGLFTYFSKKKKIMSRRSLNNYHKKYFFVSLFFEKLLHKKMSLILTNTETIKKQLIADENVENKKIMVIPNFVTSFRKKIKNKKRKFKFAYVANFIPYKNHLTLLEICSKINVNKEWELILIGADVDGFKKIIMHKTYQLGLNKKIKFYNAKNDVNSIYANIDFSVCPSSEEGSSNFLLESIYNGLPIIAFDVGGNKDFFDKNGFLVPAFDKEEMKKKIEFMLTKKINILGTNSFKICKKKFNNKKNIDLFFEAYK